MADAVNVGFARSEQLKQEWANLKREMMAIDANNPDAADRRNAIHDRMDQVMTDMTAVLSDTRRLIPNADFDVDHDPPAPPPPQDQHVQYSARKLHIIHRTYDSSSDDSDTDSSPSHKHKVDADLNDEIDVTSLRQDMMNNASPNDVVTVQGKGIRASIHLFKEKLRKPDPQKPRTEQTDQHNAPAPSPHGKPLSTDDREDLALEQSRLERESRRLKRKPQRTLDDDSRLEDIANRLSRISSTLADPADSYSAESSPAVSPKTNASPLPNKKGLFSSKPPRLERSTPLSPLADNDEELTFDSVDDELAPPSARANQRSLNSKRKKGWMALEAGVASFRALGRNIRQSTVIGARDPKAETAPGATSRSNGEKALSPVSPGGDVFADTAERLQKRGELLNNISDGAEAMSNDAGDMLAAARALRQRNQKSGFFS